MPSNETKNYKLSQWEAEDRVLRTDFNADNAKIDAALGALNAGLLRTIGAPEEIYTYTDKKGGVTQLNVRFADAAHLNWGEWEYIVLLMSFETTNSSTGDTIELITIDDLKVLVETKASPFILTLFPQHDDSKALSGFILGEGLKFFSSELTYNALTMINLDLSGNSHPEMKNIRLTILGGK